MTEMLCLTPKPTAEIECLCFDQLVCDIHIDDGGTLVCRHGSNEGIVDGIAKVICPLEIDTERVKWIEFLNQERSENKNANQRKAQRK
jgi:hypothetical protein